MAWIEGALVDAGEWKRVPTASDSSAGTPSGLGPIPGEENPELERDDAPLRRDLGLFEVTTLTAGSMIGAGIFFAPSSVAAAFPNPLAMTAVWAVGGALALAGALTFAELAAMYPHSGGPYVFAREAFGPLGGFLAGWAMLLGKLFVGPAVALVFARYLSFLFPVNATGTSLLAGWALLAVSFANWFGVRHGGRIQNVFTVLKIAGVASVVALAAVFSSGGSPFASSSPWVAPSASSLQVATAFVVVLFAYNSWYNATFVSEEVRNPGRTLPRGLALGVILVTAVYALASLAMWALLGSSAMAASQAVASDAASRAITWGGALVAAGVLVSTFGNLNGGMLVTARLVLALARDGTLPRSLRAINRHATPGNAIIVDCAVSVLLLAATDFAALVANGVVVTWAFLALIGASLPILRRTRPNERRPYRVWGYPWIPTFFVAGTAVVLAVQLVSDPFHSAVSLAALLAGLPLYAVSRVLHARSGPGFGAKTAGAPK